MIEYGDDKLFAPIMQALAQRRASVDHVLIETSGLAMQTAVMEQLQGPQLADDFVLDATLAVVDTPLLLSGQFERGALRRGCRCEPVLRCKGYVRSGESAQ